VNQVSRRRKVRRVLLLLASGGLVAVLVALASAEVRFLLRAAFEELGPTFVKFGQVLSTRPDLVPGASNNPVEGTFQGCTAFPVTAARPAGLRFGGPDLYLDPCAFSASNAQFFGNVGRSTVIGPGLATVDFSLVKNFPLPIREGAQAQFRAEFFNILNRANFRNPSSQVFDGQARAVNTVGRITNTSTSARQIQFGLKLIF